MTRNCTPDRKISGTADYVVFSFFIFFMFDLLLIGVSELFPMFQKAKGGMMLAGVVAGANAVTCFFLLFGWIMGDVRNANRVFAVAKSVTVCTIIMGALCLIPDKEMVVLGISGFALMTFFAALCIGGGLEKLSEEKAARKLKKSSV